MTPSLSDELWIFIFSYCTELYSEVYQYGALSFYFSKIIDNFLASKRKAIHSGLINYHPYSPDDSFWNGLSKHVLIWKASIKPEDIFIRHICKSLEQFSADFERTDKILFYLGKNKTFMPGHDFHGKQAQYEKSIRFFIWENLSNPLLYGYLELRRADASWMTGTKLSDWMQQYDLTTPEYWINTQFLAHFTYLSKVAERIGCHPLRERITKLYRLHAFHMVDFYIFWFIAFAVAQYPLLLGSTLTEFWLQRKFLFAFEATWIPLQIGCFLFLRFGVGVLKYYLWWHEIWYNYLIKFKFIRWIHRLPRLDTEM